MSRARSLFNTVATVSKALAVPTLNSAITLISDEGMRAKYVEESSNKREIQNTLSMIILLTSLFSMLYTASELVVNTIKFTDNHSLTRAQRITLGLNAAVGVICAGFFLSYYCNESEGAEYDTLIAGMCAAASALMFNGASVQVAFFANKKPEERDAIDETTTFSPRLANLSGDDV